VPVRVFLSYAHGDGPQHRAAVLRLARLLEAYGIEVTLDRFAENERREWSRWVDVEITAADYTIVVASPTYRLLADGPAPTGSRGVPYELGLLRELLYTDRERWLPRIVPVLLPGCGPEDIPRFLMPYNGHSIRLPSLDDEGIVALARLVTGQPAHLPGTLPPPRVITPVDETYRPEAPDAAGFAALIAERTRAFTGRGWALDRLDRAMADPEFPAGYLLVGGEPGSGKTALLGRLVQTRDYPHHFHSEGLASTSADRFFANVYAQLAARYGVPLEPVPSLPADRIAMLMRRFAAAVRAAGRVVLVVDALDESESGSTTGMLPPALPAGVHVIVSARPSGDYGLAPGFRPLRLGGLEADNRRDIEAYIRSRIDAHPDEMLPRIAQWSSSVEAFVATLTERSTGNFMYLVHVLEDIRTGRLNRANVDDVGKLPAGLQGYYARHWEHMRERDEAEFDKLHLPVLNLLAVIPEPVDLDFLIDRSNLTGEKVARVLRDWQQYLVAVPSADDVRYGFYHASFRDFLARQGAGLTPARQSLIRDALSRIPGYPGPAQ
jgi:hypothetical protein